METEPTSSGLERGVLPGDDMQVEGGPRRPRWANRVGAGGIMLPNHSPLVIAEQFGTLETLYPGRIDLALGRARRHRDCDSVKKEG